MTIETPDRNDLNKCLSDIITRRRQQLSISQEELAARAGISRTYLSDIERGLRNISITTLLKLGEAMTTRASDMLLEAEEMGCLKVPLSVSDSVATYAGGEHTAP